MDSTGIQQNSAHQDAIVALSEVLGPKGILTRAEDCARYATDQSGLAGTAPMAVLRPGTTEEVGSLMAICNRHGLGVVPQGGRTGLSGGASCPPNVVVISTERLSGIIEVDEEAMTLTTWAGTPLETVQEAARAVGLEYCVDIGARGSATIGGTIATNAGGIRVLQRGMTRDNVLGLEAVLADGTIISRLGKTVKDNSGFDLKHMFIGSEGVLGFVTRAVLKLHRHVPGTATALLALPDHAAALRCLNVTRERFGSRIVAFEGMWPDYWDFVCDTAALAVSPLADKYGFYVLIEVDSETGRAEEEFEELFADLFDREIAVDGVLAKSVAEAQSLWALREAVGEVDDAFGHHINFDIGVSPSALGAFCEAADARLATLKEAGGVIKVGHIGDGNVHLLVAHDGSTAAEHRIEAEIYAFLRDWNGAVTAEHGIGRIKAPWIGCSRSPEELAMMRALKTQLDPRGILNPGALFLD
ncbi:FAD-binding oxidoreductase [Celeribacter sp. PS-C1]|uniref:FAD-binding oxidoreductase n=1 Tax=Celeribacter sp. PS-C1 TaxID=2820813 RepID=UPI001C663E6E|nr:FAD-binding oxidoreductase [Celeribacter sp. PS-C1]MBW6417582.1 FAD-binding oxidoreductase [Celeribacter sp. PS-C1]